MIQSTDFKEFFDSLTNSKQNQNLNRGTKFTLFMVFCKTGFDNAKIMIHVIQSRKKEKKYIGFCLQGFDYFPRSFTVSVCPIFLFPRGTVFQHIALET